MHRGDGEGVGVVTEVEIDALSGLLDTKDTNGTLARTVLNSWMFHEIVLDHRIHGLVFGAWFKLTKGLSGA